MRVVACVLTLPLSPPPLLPHSHTHTHTHTHTYTHTHTHNTHDSALLEAVRGMVWRTAPAATMESCPRVQSSISTAPMPTSTRSPTVHACTIALWPTCARVAV